jgi:hypothetical protein
VNGVYKLNWSDVVPSKVPTRERKLFEKYFNDETKQYQQERNQEIAMKTELHSWQKGAIKLIQKYDDN